MLDQLLLQLADRLKRQRGFHTPFNLLVLPELPKDGKDRERIVIIKAGNPPVIAISKLYIVHQLLQGLRQDEIDTQFSAKITKAELGFVEIIPYLREVMERSLEFLPRMHHTLSLIPIADAVALRKDSKKWAKALLGDSFKTILDDRWFKVSYSVTVTDILTNTSRTLNGDNIQDLTIKAKQELSNMIIQDEALEEFRDMQERKEVAKGKEIKPNEISVSIGEGRLETRVEY